MMLPVVGRMAIQKTFPLWEVSMPTVMPAAFSMISPLFATPRQRLIQRHDKLAYFLLLK